MCIFYSSARGVGHVICLVGFFVKQGKVGNFDISNANLHQKSLQGWTSYQQTRYGNLQVPTMDFRYTRKNWCTPFPSKATNIKWILMIVSAGWIDVCNFCFFQTFVHIYTPLKNIQRQAPKKVLTVMFLEELFSSKTIIASIKSWSCHVHIQKLIF